ncbi:MAG: ACP S-malonyltransferase [Phycisphaerales bacterium]
MLLPGQGAQAVRMGKAWHDASAAARAVFARADEVLARVWGGMSGSPSGKLSEICFAGPAEVLNRTDVSQPAIYVTGVACWRALQEAGVKAESVVATAGLSLGEYTALHIAGAFSFEDGLELVALRGRAMQDAAEASVGGMVALIGADEAQAKAVCEQTLAEKPGSGEVLVCANFNAPGQIVISGSKSACDRAAGAEGAAAKMGLRATALVVAGAFHSPLMAPAAERLGAALSKTAIGVPRCAVMSNVTGLPHGADADGIRALLKAQLTSPVRWSENCAALVKMHGGKPGVEFHELAPGRTLAGLYRRIDKGTKVVTHDEPEALATSGPVGA